MGEGYQVRKLLKLASYYSQNRYVVISYKRNFAGMKVTNSLPVIYNFVFTIHVQGVYFLKTFMAASYPYQYCVCID